MAATASATGLAGRGESAIGGEVIGVRLDEQLGAPAVRLDGRAQRARVGQHVRKVLIATDQDRVRRDALDRRREPGYVPRRRGIEDFG